MKKILVIEDEDIAAARLLQILRKLMPDAEIDGPLESISQSVNYLTTKPAPDLIFLDIQLADGISFSIFNEVKILSPVIFTTAFDEFAIRAFEINCIDYLLKPIDEHKLKTSIDKFNSLSGYYKQSENLDYFKELANLIHVKSPYKNRFLINKGNSLIPLSIDEVAYFLAEDKIVLLYTCDGKRYVINYTLDALETQLNPSNFFRINRHCILSSKAIVKVHNYFNYKLKIEVLPPAADELILSKSRSAEFKDWMNS